MNKLGWRILEYVIVAGVVVVATDYVFQRASKPDTSGDVKGDVRPAGLAAIFADDPPSDGVKDMVCRLRNDPTVAPDRYHDDTLNYWTPNRGEQIVVSERWGGLTVTVGGVEVQKVFTRSEKDLVRDAFRSRMSQERKRLLASK